MTWSPTRRSPIGRKPEGVSTLVCSGCARPRMYARGATSMTPAAMSLGMASGSIMSCRAS
uniref:zinc finger domain-containing protein n=1 Tax=Nocardia farcinica TaxID=37329 RepID=UPI0036F3A82D